MDALVSIIIPIYNAEKTLESCLVSCLRQTLQEIEILLIDDGSTDRSLAIASAFLSRFPEKIRIFRQPNSGPSAARNLGLKHATGKYIGFLDADDRVDRDMFLRLFLAAQANQSDLVVCGRYDVVYTTDKLTMFKRSPHTFPCASVFEVPELLSGTTQFVWDKLFLREIITTHGLHFDERFRYTEDVLFLCIYKYYCRRIYILPDLLYYHYIDERNPLTKYGVSLLDVPKVLLEVYAVYPNSVFPYPDVLFDLTAKRFLFRLKRFPYMGSKQIQLKFCRSMYRIMRRKFPDWRRRIVSYHRAGYRGGLSQFYLGSLFLISLYVLLPNKFKQACMRYSETVATKFQSLHQRIVARKARRKRYTDLSLNAYYHFFLTHRRNHPDRVFIQSKGGRVPSGNMFALLSESLRRKKKIVLALKKEERKQWKDFCTNYDISPLSVRTVQPETYRYYRLLATSTVLLNDSTFPHRFLKKAGQIYLNTWHGVPLKHMGCDVPARAYAIGDVQRNFLQADYLLFPNPFMQDIMLRSYMLDTLYRNAILQEAYPRNTILTDNTRRDSLRSLLGFTDKRICCYLPTWRGIMTKKENTRQHKDCLHYLNQLDSQLGDDVILYVKLHPYAERGFHAENYRHIRMFPSNYETYDFLTVCDVLITDYSSVFFDFAVTGRKIILFAYDYEEYKAGRGLYLDPETLPFPLVRTVDELLHEINAPKQYDDTEFLRTYCPYPAEKAPQRICDLLYHDSVPCSTRTTRPLPSVRLYYGGVLRPGATYFHLLYLLQKESDTPFITAICGSELKDSPERIRKLLSVSSFLSVDAEFYFTPAEALAYRLLITRHTKPFFLTSLLHHYLRRLLLREYCRKFGQAGTVFRDILVCNDTEDRNCRMLSLPEFPQVNFIFPERTYEL